MEKVDVRWMRGVERCCVIRCVESHSTKAKSEATQQTIPPAQNHTRCFTRITALPL